MSILEPEAVERELPFSSQAFGFDETATDGDASEWDKLLEDLVKEESERIWGWLHIDDVETAFEETTAEATLDGNGRDELSLPKRPIRDVSSVVVYKDGRDYDLEIGTEVIAEETHLALIPREAPIRNFPDGRRTVDVEWTYGNEGVPGDVKDGLVRLVRSRLERIQSDGLESESVPTGQSASYRPPEEIIDAVKRSVIKHRPPEYGSGAMVI